MSEGIDYGAFSNNGIDSVSDNSWIIRQFNAKNKRVNAIFREDNDDEDVFGQRQSHGLRLESLTAGSTISDKENNSEKTSQHSSGHMRALSPKSVHEADPEEINEIRPRLMVNPHRRSDLRRSLFKQNETKQRLLTTNIQEMTCSTPMATKRSTMAKSTFMDESLNISPIKNLDRYNLLRNEDGVEAIEAQKNIQKTPSKVVQITTLKDIEKDLREQYQVDADKTPRSKQTETSFRSEPGRSPAKSTATKSMQQRRPSAPTMSMSKVKQCSILIEPMAMEMSEELVKTYRQSRLQRLSVSQCNKTDNKSMKIAETPVASANNHRRPEVDEELAKRLRLCESNNEMTSDEEEEEVPEQEAIVPQVESNAHTVETAKSPAKNSTFKRPQSILQNDEMSVVSQNSSINKKVSENVLESLRELRRTITNETANSIAGVLSNQTLASQSCRLNVTKKRRASKASGQIEEYMKLTNKRKKSKDANNKKRTLYSHHSDEEDDENVSPQSSIASSVQNKASVEVIFLNENNNASEDDSDSEPECAEKNFKRPYKPGPLKTKKKYGVVSQKEASVQESSPSVDGTEIRETPKSSRPSGNRVEVVEARKSQKEKQQREIESEMEEIHQESVPEPKTRSKRQGNKKQNEVAVETNSEAEEPRVETTKKPRRRSPHNAKKVQEPIEEQPSKKSRGRPAKVQTVQQTENEESDEEPSEQSIPVEKQPPKKSRGRPAKVQTPVQQSANEKSDEETEQQSVQVKKQPPKKPRGRPPKVQKPVQQTENEELDEEIEQSNAQSQQSNSRAQSEMYDFPAIQQSSEEEEQPASPPKKQKSNPPTKQSKPKQSQRDVSKKRKQPDERSSDDEVPIRRRRRVSENSDEGFNESNDSDFDVLWVPDSDRYSLRKRRMCKPWWIPSAPSNMRIQFVNYSSADIKAEKKIKKITKKTGINPSKAFHGSNAFAPPPTEILKVMEELAKDKKKNYKVAEFVKKARPRTHKATSSTASSVDHHDGTGTEPSGASVQIDVSMQTTQKSVAPSEAIYQAFKDLSEAPGQGRRVEITENFDVAQFDSIDWVECSNGLLFYSFLGQEGDGLIKLLPGASKNKSRTKNSILKFVILCGEASFIINDIPKTVKNFGYVNIREGQRYEIKNNGDKEVIISFTRLAPPNRTN